MKYALPAAAALLLLTSCSSTPPAESAPPEDPLDQMLITFNGSPSKTEIKEAMDDALNATNMVISDDHYSRAASVLTAFREEYGIDEMDILECIPGKVADPRVPELDFGNVAAVCNVDLVSGVQR